ncbi:DEAD/DEAH box helicase [Candidatus Bathyarchaeota archaeon]|nr:DEAD/DEAH box helicase [Candidatus Bathyarchaeota archaeon]
MRVEDLPISDQVKHILTENGYDTLYPPQADAVAAGALLGKNVVLASPTASGKTLVAELAVLKKVLDEQAKALYLTPLRALASEKYEEFRKYSKLEKQDGHRVRIAITSGDYDRSDEHLGSYDIVIATNEKADSLLRHRAKWVSDVALVVADEVHLLNEADRGPTLEVVMTRLRKLNPKIQLLALSATVRNAAEVADWIGASAVTTEWRPVPLKEGVYCENEIHFRDGSSKTIQPITGNPIMDMPLQTIKEGGQALLFTETRRSAVETGRRAAAILSRVASPSEKRSCGLLAQRIRTSGEKTRLSEMLADQVAHGAGFHHAGLHNAHRKIVEDAFREGKIKILAATPTLAAGVNLPARLVVITSHERYEAGYGRYPISVLEYKQFCGRAGRPKYDEYGEAVLIARTEDEREALFENYVVAEPERLWSKLGVEKVLRPHVLSTIATGFAHTEEGLRDFFSSTFYAYQYGPRAIGSRMGDILAYLAKEEMIEYDRHELRATRFGQRVSELYIDPVSAVIIKDGLYRRAADLTDFSFLHLIARTPDIAPRIYPRRGEDEKLAAMAAERAEQFMCETPDEIAGSFDPGYEDFLAEVKTAAVLLDWIQETSEDAILNTHRVEPGDVMRLVQISNWLLYSAYELAELFGHKDLRKPLGQLRLRVEKGAMADLIPLLSLQGVGRARARALHNAGFKTIEDIRKASPSDLTAIPLIGTKLAKKIMEQAGGLIKSEEWEELSSTREETEQSLLTEY